MVFALLRGIMKSQGMIGIAIILLPVLVFGVFPLAADGSAGPVEKIHVGYLYNLSDFTETIPYSWPKVMIDNQNRETILLYQNRFRIFNDSGMEIYRFGDNMNVYIVDATTNSEGRLLGLSPAENSFSIVRFDFMGKVTDHIAPRGLPPSFSNFRPNEIVWKNGLIYLAEMMGMRVVIVDEEGNYKEGYDLIKVLDLEEKDRDSIEMMGFNVDNEGGILFTIAVYFRAYRLLPDGTVESFGHKGSAPGLFGVVAGIARDSKGNYLVADKLRSVIMIFDKQFNFITEFGYYGSTPGKLTRPEQIAVDSQDRVYVTQGRRLGVSVFRITHR